MALRAHGLSNTQGCECLPSAAGHDEFASITLLKPGDDILNCVLLMLARNLSGAKTKVLWLLQVELRPVYRAGVEVLDAQAHHRFRLMGERMFGVFAPLVRCRNDDAGGEQLLAGRGEE